MEAVMPHTLPDCREPAALPPALVIYSRNTRHVLPALLAAVQPAAARLNCPVLVVDDASEDGSREWLTSRQSVDSLLLDRRYGTAEALNRGFARFPNRDVIRLHGAVVPENPDWLEKILEAAANLPDAGVIGVRLVTSDGRILSEGRRIVTGLGLTWQEADRSYLHADGPAPSAPAATDSVAGDLAWYRRTALHAVGGLDPAYSPEGLEADDFCFAARVHGFDVYVLPEVRALCLRPAPPPDGAQAPILAALEARRTALYKAQTEYWNAKWGWDPLLPDLGEIRRLYGRTRVCWATGDVLRLQKMEPFPAVDLCMVTWNGAALLPRCLESLGRTDYPPDRLCLYLVDNASTDATPSLLPDLIRRLPFACRVIRPAVNTGGVVGLNWAFAQGTAPFLAKLDDDIVLPPDWLRRLLDVFRKRPFAGVVGPRIVDDTPARLIQCADHAYYPVPGCHEQERDDGSTGYMARVTHVRGCCNVYRRDVLERCGPLDIRFSPSQWDDPDHHMALLTAGYEVIYDGSTAVAHKCSTGAAGGTSLGHAAINKAKMLLKWGADSPQVLECSLLLSREGRFLPDSGNTQDWQDRGPSPSLFPRTPSSDLVRHMQEETNKKLAPCEETAPARLSATARLLCTEAADSYLKGDTAAARIALRTAVSCAPHDPLPLLALADLLDDAGAPSEGLRSRAALLQATEHLPATALPGRPDRFFPPPPRPTAFERAPKGTTRGNVLFCLPHARRMDTALADLIRNEAAALAGHGFAVRASAEPAPPQGPWDVIHFWTLDTPHETLLQMKAARCASPDTPLVLSPLWRDPAGRAAAAAVFQVLRDRNASFPPETLPHSRSAENSDYPLLRRLALSTADAVVLAGRGEEHLLAAPLPRTVFTELPPLLSVTEMEKANPRLFHEAGGPSEFILAVAPFCPLANQAMLIAAAAELGLPLVLAGDAADQEYLHACRRLAPSNVLFIKEMEKDLLASAFAAARIYALPQWGIPGQLAERAALSAALAGKPVVAAADGPEAWLLDRSGMSLFHACDPGSVRSVRAALLSARQKPVDEKECMRLKSRFAPSRAGLRLAGLYTSLQTV